MSLATIPAAPSSPGVVDFAVPEIVRVRTHDARGTDLAAVARDVGSPVSTGAEPPHVVVRFVDELSPAQLRLVDGGTMGYADDGVYFMDSSGGTALARVSQGAEWGEAVIVCRRGAGRVPLLSAAVDLTALSRGWAPLHGSAWTTRDGAGVLVTGWANSGKTGALLAACERGATPVGDDRILLSGDGASMVGVGRPIVVKAWHLAQLRIPGLGARPVRRMLARAVPTLDALSEYFVSRRPGGGVTLTRFAGKVLGRLRESSVLLDPNQVGRSTPAARTRTDVLIILETHRRRAVVAEAADPNNVANRIAAQVEAELLPTLRAQLAFKYAFPGRGWADIGRAPEVAEGILGEATRRIPTYVVRHPYPCSLRELDEVITGVVSSLP